MIRVYHAENLPFEVLVATPKGMRTIQFPVNCSDTIHIYSDATHIQLRGDVPTEQDIGRSSFKVAFCMQPGTALRAGMRFLFDSRRRLRTTVRGWGSLKQKSQITSRVQVRVREPYGSPAMPPGGCCGSTRANKFRSFIPTLSG